MCIVQSSSKLVQRCEYILKISICAYNTSIIHVFTSYSWYSVYFFNKNIYNGEDIF